VTVNIGKVTNFSPKKTDEREIGEHTGPGRLSRFEVVGRYALLRKEC